MKSFLLLCFAITCYTSLCAQRKTFVTVKAGDNIMDVLPAEDVFFYPQFTSGKVVLRDGTEAEARMNYNRLVDEIHFINPKGDTLAVDNEKNIRYAAIAKDTFYYDGGYLKLLSTGISLKLAMKQIWVISETRQLGAYNSTNTSVSVVSYGSYNQGGRLYDLTVNEDVILTKAGNYYFGDHYNHFVIADKKNLLTLFPEEEARIRMYLKENKINFNNKDDLEKIVQFLHQP